MKAKLRNIVAANTKEVTVKIGINEATKGLETIINIILVRYCSEENYEEFKNIIMKSENLIFIRTEVKISSIRGEF